MLAIPDPIAVRTNSVNATEPMLVAAIFAENGASDSLSTFSRLQGLNDPAKSQDANINYRKTTQELILGNGVNVTLAAETASMPAVNALIWNATVRSVQRAERYWDWGYHTRLVHDYFAMTQTRRDPELLLKFVAQGSFHLNTLRLGLANVGNYRTTLQLRIFDLSNPSAPAQIGTEKTLALAANTVGASYLFTGFAANLQKGKNYALAINYFSPDPAYRPGAWELPSYNLSINVQVFGFAMAPSSGIFQIPLLGLTGAAIPLGGATGFAASGVAYRSLDVCATGKATPSINGIFSYSDTIAAGTALSVTGYATNNPALFAVAGVAGWDVIGLMTSGMSVLPYRYWRFAINLTSTVQSDDTPSIANITVTYMNPPLLLGTHAQEVNISAAGNAFRAIAIKAIHQVSSSTAALNAQAKTVMTGKITLELAPEPIVQQLFAYPLRGKRVILRAGYADIPDNVLYYDGVIRDLAFAGGKYILTIQDPIELADISIPRLRWNQWDAAATYIAADCVLYQDKPYSLVNVNTPQLGSHVGKNPLTYSAIVAPATVAYWMPYTTPWQNVAYLNGTHLCDVAADLLQNQINLPDEKIDIASLNAVKAQYPARITTGRDLQQPTKAISLLTEIAWLCESYWVMRDGKLSLIAEALATDLTIMDITPNDIKEGLEYRRGWAELKNEVLIFSNWQGGGTANDTFRDAVAIADAQSVYDYSCANLQEFQDKFNVAKTELTLIANSFLTRWKNGRRIVRISCSMRVLPLECGDVIRLNSAQLPIGDSSTLKAIIQQKDLNWMNQTIQLTLLEV